MAVKGERLSVGRPFDWLMAVVDDYGRRLWWTILGAILWWGGALLGKGVGRKDEMRVSKKSERSGDPDAGRGPET